MCRMVKYLNNLDTEDLIILILLTFLRSDKATATEGFYVSADLDPVYTVRNILFEATFFERMSVFEVRVFYKIVFTTQRRYALKYVIGHVTLRPVLRAEWSDNRKRRVHGASMEPMISVKLSTLKLFY